MLPRALWRYNTLSEEELAQLRLVPLVKDVAPDIGKRLLGRVVLVIGPFGGRIPAFRDEGLEVRLRLSGA